MRILVTGSREWADTQAILLELRAVAEGESDVTLVHGGARGADQIAARWAENLGWTVEEHEANWDSCGPDCNDSHKRRRYTGELYCPRSGFVRNAEMVKLGADICVAFYKGASKGTDMCAALAEKAGIKVVRVMDPYD